MNTKVKVLTPILICFTIALSGIAPVFADQEVQPAEMPSENEIVWIMDSPQIWVYDTYYTGLGSYYTRVNDEQKVFKGEPYQYESTTYLPLRDICETFGIHVSYDNKDRSITISTKDKCLILASSCLSDNGGYVIIEKDSGYVRVEEHLSYDMVEGMAYTSLQPLAEVFEWQISYEESGSRIKVSGSFSAPDEGESWFSEEQKLFIEAAKNMESAKYINISVTDGLEEKYSSTVIREFGKNGGQVTETTYTTLVNGDQYWGLRALDKSTLSRGVSKILPDGAREGLDLGHAAMGNHTYNNMSMTFVEGIRKYEEMEIQTLARTDNEVIYQVTFTYWKNSAGGALSIEAMIDLTTETIIKYVNRDTPNNQTTHFFFDYMR